MEAKDLMIDDLVKYKDKIIKVYDIITGWGGSPCVNGCWETWELLDCIYIKDLEPIPLTEEILEKWGFEKFDLTTREQYEYDPLREPCYAYGYFPEGRDKGYYIVISILENDDEKYAFNSDKISMKRIKNVHEAQHIMRIEGFNELADSLKL